MYLSSGHNVSQRCFNLYNRTFLHFSRHCTVFAHSAIAMNVCLYLHAGARLEVDLFCTIAYTYSLFEFVGFALALNRSSALKK
jgi:hypothetical protein